MSEKKPTLSRRAFLGRTAALAALPAIVPASVFGRDGAVPPSERIIMGGIGIGTRGSYVLNWMLPEKDVQFVADCDPQKQRRENVKRIIDTRYGNSDCKLYADIREFLATRTDIDAVLSTTGDRWHATAAVMAMRAGKDIYSEKPSAMTIAEGQAVVETARRYRRVYQSGIQRLSEGNFTFANELLRLAISARSIPSGRTSHRGTPPRCGTTGCRPSPCLRKRRWTGTPGWVRVRGDLTTRPIAAAIGATTMTSTRAASGNGAPTRSPSARWRSGCGRRRPSNTST